MGQQLAKTFLLGGKLPLRRLGFGAMQLTGRGVWGEPENREEAKRVLQRAVELGINLIDTADAYGPDVSENLIAEALYPYPVDLVIATKGGLTRQGPNAWAPVGRAEYLIQCVEMSLRRLRRDYIDLYQLHRIDPKTPLEESLKALQKLQQQGKIRFIGLSEVTIKEIEQAQKIVRVDTVQNLYHLMNRQSEGVLNYCEEYHLGFIPWFPLGSGDIVQEKGLIEKIANENGITIAQLALAWLLKKSHVMLPIPGTASIKHLEENAAAQSVQLSDEDYTKLNSLL
ncbi:MAG: aldo/keto reductase [Parachlamydiaceae bacterium]